MQSNLNKVDPLPILQRLLETFFAHYDSWYERYKATTQAYCHELAQLNEKQGVHRWVDDNFSAELALVPSELEFLYGTTASETESKENKHQDTRKFLFAGAKCIDRILQDALARQAVRAKQGLEPKRGLVKIQ
jgi:hypothetical protein